MRLPSFHTCPYLDSKALEYVPFLPLLCKFQPIMSCIYTQRKGANSLPVKHLLLPIKAKMWLASNQKVEIILTSKVMCPLQKQIQSQSPAQQPWAHAMRLEPGL